MNTNWEFKESRIDRISETITLIYRTDGLNTVNYVFPISKASEFCEQLHSALKLFLKTTEG